MNSFSHKTISVIIPTLGTRSVYLIEAITSVLAQSHKPTEIIIVNNGLFDLSEMDFNFRALVPIFIVNVVSKAGAPQARNIGAAMARGELLSFLDDDDLWGTSFLHDSLFTLLDEDSDCCIGRLDKLEEMKISSFMFAQDLLSIRSFLVMNPGVTGSNMLIRATTFRSIGGFDPCITPTEDRGIMLEILKGGHKVSFSDSSQAIMRMHSGERLTASSTLNIGFRRFHIKYKHLMSWKDRIYSNWLFRREEFKNCKSLPRGFSLMLLSCLIVLIRRRPSQIWSYPENVL